MRKASILAVVVAVVALITVSPAQQSRSNEMPTGKAFLDKAAEINLGEVELGKLAEQKGNNEAVKDFGKRMIEDHTRAEHELQQVPSKKG